MEPRLSATLFPVPTTRLFRDTLLDKVQYEVLRVVLGKRALYFCSLRWIFS